MRVSLQLNNFNARNYNVRNDNSKPSGNNSVNTGAALSASESFDSVSFGAIFQRKRGSVAKAFYRMSSSYKSKYNGILKYMQEEYGLRFLKEAGSFARDVADENGHIDITQDDRVEAVRKNLKYLLTDPAMVTGLRMTEQDGYGNSYDYIKFGTDAQANAFEIMRSGLDIHSLGHNKGVNYYNALVQVLMEDFEELPGTEGIVDCWGSEDVYKNANGFPLSRLESALRKFGVVDETSEIVYKLKLSEAARNAKNNDVPNNPDRLADRIYDGMMH